LNRRSLFVALGAILAIALVASWLLTRVDGSPAPWSQPAGAPGIGNGASAARPEPVDPEVAQQLMAERARAVRAMNGPRPRAPEPGVLPTSPSGGVPTPSDAPPGPRLVPDAAVPFPLSRDGIRGAIGAKIPEVKECYEEWLKQNPKLAGRMVVGFTISADDAGTGGVSKVAVIDGGLGHALMEGCVLNSFHDLRFEAPDGELTVHYPLAFSSDEDGGG
jgi:hypothetical protein